MGTVYSVPIFPSHPENVGAASGRRIRDCVISIRTNHTHIEGEFMLGTTISHYKVIEKIRQGGMGEVYRSQEIVWS